MSNTLLTLTMITREALRILHNNLVFAKGVNRQYSQEFAQTGAKIGTSVNVRKPNKYPIRVGQTLSISGTNETYIPLTLTTQAGVDTSFSSQDLALTLDDFGKRILSPAMSRVSSKVDFDGLAQAAQIYNNVGTPGTTPGANTGANLALTTAPQIYLNAGMLMDNMATPRDENRRVIFNPIAQATSVANLSGLFQDAGSIGEQYRKGVMGTALGFEFAMDQNVNIQGSGTHSATTVVTGTSGQSGSTLAVVASNAATVLPGETFTIANVFSVNPENLQSTGLSQQFVVLPSANSNGAYTCDAGGNVVLNISPAIVGPSSPVNPLQTVTALPAGGASLTFNCAANGSTYVNNLAYHQDAFTLATADLILPGGVDFAARENYDGISMRIVRAYDITNDLFPTRTDILYGFATLRPEMACRIWG